MTTIDPRFVELARTGDARLRDELVVDNQGLAYAFAHRYRDRGVPVDDLRQIGIEALIKAVDRFDPERGLQFSTFAGRTIDGELKQYFRDRTWDVRVPRSVRQLAARVRGATDELTQQLGRSPTAADIAASLDVAVSDVVLAMDASSAYRTESLDAVERTGGADTGEEAYSRVDAAVLAPQLLALLAGDERRAVELRFFDGLVQSEIAGILGVSQMQVSRLLQRALGRLRSAVATDDG